MITFVSAIMYVTFVERKWSFHVRLFVGKQLKTLKTYVKIVKKKSLN